MSPSPFGEGNPFTDSEFQKAKINGLSKFFEKSKKISRSPFLETGYAALTICLTLVAFL